MTLLVTTEHRLGVESTVARLAASRRNTHHLERLEATMDAFRDAASSPGFRRAVPACHWESIATTGIQCWYGGLTNVTPDRHGRLIGFPPNASELLAIPDAEIFCVLP